MPRRGSPRRMALRSRRAHRPFALAGCGRARGVGDGAVKKTQEGGKERGRPRMRRARHSGSITGTSRPLHAPAAEQTSLTASPQASVGALRRECVRCARMISHRSRGSSRRSPRSRSTPTRLLADRAPCRRRRRHTGCSTQANHVHRRGEPVGTIGRRREFSFAEASACISGAARQRRVSRAGASAVERWRRFVSANCADDGAAPAAVQHTPPTPPPLPAIAAHVQTMLTSFGFVAVALSARP